MPVDYAQPGVNISPYFEEFLGLLPSRSLRDEAISSYWTLFPDLPYSSDRTNAVKSDIEVTPIRLFKWVSAALGEPLPGLGAPDREHIAANLRIPLSDIESITVNDQGDWSRELVVEADTGETLRIDRYSHKFDTAGDIVEIVPSMVYDFIRSGVVSFRANNLAAAITMCAIPYEACLREVLTGLKQNTALDRVIYTPVSAKILGRRTASASTEWDIHLQIGRARISLHKHFAAQTPRKDGSPHKVAFNVRRQDLASGRPVLQLEPGDSLSPNALADLLSSDKVESSKSKKLRYFSEFNRKAEEIGLLSTLHFRGEAPEVLNSVRNALVHLDTSALQKGLANGQTVADYVDNPATVRTAMVSAADFISRAYYYLREKTVAVLSNEDAEGGR